MTSVACTPSGNSDIPKSSDTESSQAAESGLSPSAATLPPASELLPNGREPFTGVFTGGQPSLKEFEKAASLGVSTVINLRMPGERGAKKEDIEALGMRYVAIPVDGAEGLTIENARALAAALANSETPVIVHCGSGNRVGALFALKANQLDGKSAEEALAIGLAAGVTKMEPVVRKLLGLE